MNKENLVFCVLCQDEDVSCSELLKKYDGSFKKMDENICNNHQEKLMKVMFG